MLKILEPVLNRAAHKLNYKVSCICGNILCAKYGILNLGFGFTLYHLLTYRIHQEKQIISRTTTNLPPPTTTIKKNNKNKKNKKKPEDKKDTSTTDLITLTVFLCPSCLVLLFNSFLSCNVPEIKRYKILFQNLLSHYYCFFDFFAN